MTQAATPCTLDALNAAATGQALAWLDGIYEHSPWVAEAALRRRPFASLAQLKQALVAAVRDAGREAQLALLRAHPELADRLAVARLTADSAAEQRGAGLDQCTPEEFERFRALNRVWRERFGFPFIVAVRGPRGTGLHRRQILAAMQRRETFTAEQEFAEALRQVHRIAELRLNDRFGQPPQSGNRIWDWLADLARHSDAPATPDGHRPLTVTYLTPAHRACAADIAQRMADCGFDEVQHDAVGNVVGLYHGARADACRLLTGSHYDTVRNAGAHDGRLGIFVPMAVVQQLAQAGRRLPCAIELVAFAEEEGQRFAATFLGSGALTGDFDPAWLEQRDAEGVSLREAMQAAGLPADMGAIAALRRDPKQYLGFVEVHIEQGPVLNSLDLPLGVVTGINGGVRYRCEVLGLASHAGTTPMDQRHDALLAAAELALWVERRAMEDGDSVGTVGVLQVPGGSVNVVPGRCAFTLDLRAPSDAQRSRLALDVVQALGGICARRGLRSRVEETMRAAAAPSDPRWQARWERAVAALGLPVHRLASGAGHDAMKLHRAMPQAMLFVRGENNGISHNPLESTTSDDIELAAQAFARLLDDLARELA